MSRQPDRQPPRAPGYTALAVTIVTMVLVAAVALNAQQPPPPAIAEFAPQALEQIKDAPPDQAQRGAGGAATPTPSPGSSVGPGVSPSAFPSNVPRTRRCYGNPPRQTEDPQSPPCVPYWDPKQDNGGATSFGVTRDEIRIAWPQTIEKSRDTEDLATYFNLRYEFYGRKLRLIPFGPRGGVFGAANAADMQADADKVRDQVQAFASLSYVPRAGVEHYYYDRLARHRIISVDSHASQRNEAHFDRFHPYQWGYLPAFDVQMRNVAAFICAGLEGRAPRYAGTGVRDQDRRRFGLVYHVAPEGSTPDRSVLLNAMRAQCGLEPVVTTAFTTAQQTVLKLKEARATTVVCLCQGGHYFELMPEATNQVYFPEWLVSSYHYLDYDASAQRYPPEHQDHVFGITFHNKWLPQKEMPWYQAIKEADPEWETGDDGFASAAYERYYELLVIASGIQMAGPRLTPETFQRGLTGARFPAPGSGGPPLWHPGGGFARDDHTMVDDAAMIWYSPSEQGYTTNVRRGTYCYVDRGKRATLGAWPRGDAAFFRGSCK